MKIIIKQKDIKAVATAMAVKDIRSYLNGMLVESNGVETRLVAIDGHRLHAVAVNHQGNDLAETINVILPAKFVAALLKEKFHYREVAEFELDMSPTTVIAKIIKSDKVIASCAPMDSQYPDWRKIIPDQYTGEYARIGSNYLLDAEMAWAVWGGLSPENHYLSPDIVRNGSSPAKLEDGDFVAIIMPTRYPSPAKRRPSSNRVKERF